MTEPYKICPYCETVFQTAKDVEESYAKLVRELDDPLIHPENSAEFIRWCTHCLRRWK